MSQRSPITQEEAAFLAGYDSNAFPRPSVAVDVVVLAVLDRRLSALLVRRREHPFLGQHALPGGFVRLDESLEEAAGRVLHQKAGVRQVYLEQLHTFGAVDRDPRGRVISVTWLALVGPTLAAGPDSAWGALEVPWPDDTGGPVSARDRGGAPMPLAFDHDLILGEAVRRCRRRLDHDPIDRALLPAQFTLRQLQDVHEAVLGRPVNKDSFRRRMLARQTLEETGERQEDVEHRPAALYRFRAG